MRCGNLLPWYVLTSPGDILPGQTRFRVDRLLGRGAHGSVYEAFDVERGQPVAVKILRRVDPEAIYRFKKEFRSVAALRHPNLVRMHELLSVDGTWVLTMDVADGEDFVTHVRPGGRLDEARLRDGLRQLAGGVLAIHAAGKLHRDLKPANLRVDARGHLTILDFGLATTLQVGMLPERSLESEGDLIGTPMYMSPEQADGGDVNGPADWYSVGGVLFQALTGRPPFAGNLMQILAAKLEPPPDADAGPADLVELCRRLMAREPGDRPDGDELGRLLGVPVAAPPAVARHDVRMIGRGAELEALEAALRRSREERRAVVAHLRGPSGMGKSTLASHFMRRAREQHGALVLHGRCHEHESVPYRAVDTFVDELVKHLGRLPRPTARHLTPEGAGALVKLFPVLAAVDAFAIARAPTTHDPHTLRRQGFAALRELLHRLAATRPLAVHLDDLQWGDEGSAGLLEELMRPPGAPPLLLLVSYRFEDEGRSPVVSALRRLGPDLDLELGPLEPQTGARLASEILGRRGIVDSEAERRIARESEGSPFFIHELALHAAEHARRPVSLDQLLGERIALLSPPRRRLLEIVAAAGAPLRFDVASRAAELAAAEATDAVAALSEASLLRTRGTVAQELEVFHDRIADAVVGLLGGEDRRARHAAIAGALEGSGELDARLAMHFRLAGDAPRAARYSERAAAHASAALAFDQAVSSLRDALELSAPGDRRRLRALLGQALADAGKSREAADELVAAAAGAPAGEALGLQRRAAEQLLRGGHLSEGAGLIGTALASVGLAVPATPARAIAQLLWRRARLKLRGLGFVARRSSEIAPERLTRLDMCWAAAQGLGYTDLVRGMDFQVRHLLLALDAGEPFRVVRGLAAEAMFLSASGDTARGATVVARAAEVAARTGRPEARLFVELAAGLNALCAYRFDDARAAMARVPEMASGHEAGARWEINTAQYFEILAMLYAGDVDAVAQRVPQALAEARDRGDLYTQVTIGAYPHGWLLMARDQPVEALRAIDDAIAPWSYPGFHLQHLSHLMALAEIRMYQGDPHAARRALREAAAPMARSQVLRTRFLGVRLRDFDARIAVACARDAGDPLLEEALGHARRLDRENNGWARWAADLTRALVAHRRGQESAPLFEDAEAGALAADMRGVAAAIRRQRGQAAGDRTTVSAAEATLRSLGVRAPDRYAAMIAPLSPPG